MLKRLVAALALLALCIAICFSSSYLISKASNDLTQTLESTARLLDENKNAEAAEKMRGCEDKWNDYSDIFSIFLDHNELQVLNINIPSVEALIAQNNNDIALEKIEEIINSLDEITHEQKINIGNIL